MKHVFVCVRVYICVCVSPLTLADVDQFANAKGDDVDIGFQPVSTLHLVNWLDAIKE